MRVAGFTFIRNALLYDYPVVEAIRSVLPLCDIFVVAVGHSDDATLQLIQSIGDDKIHIIETIWDDGLRAGGQVLAIETDKAFQSIPSDYDWCFYIQADECVHEEDFPAIRAGMEKYLHDEKTDGLLFKYRHFYGSYDYIGVSRRWYRREVRIIKNNKNIRSYRDAQGFRLNDAKLNVRLLDAHIHHYGWVKHPEAQLRKQLNFNKLWHNDDQMQSKFDLTDYHYDGLEPLEKFHGTHPTVMHPRIMAQNWQFSGDPTQGRWSWKDSFSHFLEHWTGWRPFEYRNYRLFFNRSS